MTTLRLVLRETPATIFFDFDDSTGVNNPQAITTKLRDLDIGGLGRPLTVVKQKGAPLGTRALSDPQARTVKLTMDVDATSMATLAAGIGELYRVLTSEAITDYLLAWDDNSGVRFFEPLGAPDGAPSLRTDSLQFAVVRDGRDISLPIAINCQPFLVSTERTSDVNVVANATLGVEGTTANRPTSWTWDSTTNITAEALDATNDAYTFTIATTGTRNLQQTTAVGSATTSDVFTDSFYVKAAAGSIARCRAVIRYCDSGGSVLGSETTSSQVTITTAYQRLTVTSAAAPATTSRILVTLRFENIAATSVQVWVRDSQCEKAATASGFRIGNESVDASPADPFGMVFPLVIDGTAPTPVTFDIQCGASSRLTSMRMGARSNYGRDGRSRLLDYANESKYIGIPTTSGGVNAGWTTTLGTGTTVVSDASAVSGSAAAISVTSTLSDVRLRRFRSVRTTNLDSLRGEWLAIARVEAMQVEVDWELQLQYGLGTADPVANAEDPVLYSVSADSLTTGWEYVPLGVMRIPDYVNLGAVVVEVWASRATETGTDPALLRVGDVFFVPYSPRARVKVRSGGKVVWDDNELGTPGLRLSQDPGGYWHAGERLDGGAIRLNSAGESIGVSPKGAAQVWGGGVAEVTFTVDRLDNGGYQYKVRVARFSPSELVMAFKRVQGPGNVTLRFDATDTHTYQPQATHDGVAGERFTVSKITRKFTPFLASGDRLVSDPEQLEATKRDTNGNVTAACDVEGQTPFVLEPGRYIITMVPGEAALDGHEGEDAPLSRLFTVRTRYSPRWTQ